MRAFWFSAVVLSAALAAGLVLRQQQNDEAPVAAQPQIPQWSPSQMQLLQSLALPPSQAQTEPLSPLAIFGKALFFDTTLNPNKTIACASCHEPEQGFSDGLKHPVDEPKQRNTPTLYGVANNRWQFWDGRSDSLWSMTFGPLFSSHELALQPQQLLNSIGNSSNYRQLYANAFEEDWPAPTPAYQSDVGINAQLRMALALEAFMQTIAFPLSPFDHYVHSLANDDTPEQSWLTPQQLAGIEVFLDSNCLSCHRGNGFSSDRFHNIGTGETDSGRLEGKSLWEASKYNCEGELAKGIGRACNSPVRHGVELPRLQNGAFKTPSLRQLTHTAPYMHDGRFEDLSEVIEHYRNPPETAHALANMPDINELQAAQLAAFLQSLSAPLATEPAN